jgi:endogenous inhibitor of DNA gyrase (YacG/DUF329 family)
MAQQQQRKLMLRCPSCKRSFPSRLIQMDETSFKTTTLSGNSEPCPHCGRTSTYSKQDYFFQ